MLFSGGAAGTGLSLDALAELTHYFKSYLGHIETGVRTATVDVVAAYE